MTPNEIIREFLDVRDGDTLPFTGFKNRTREDLPELFKLLGYTSGAEIGVCSGEYSESILKVNPDMRLLLVDPWGAYRSPWDFWVTTQRAADRLEKTKERLVPYKNVEFVRKTSLQAAAEVPDNSLDMVYIDGLHDFDNVMMDLIVWSKKVRSTGLVIGHDFWQFYGSDVVPAVNAYISAHRITEWYVTREQSCSFLWLKK